MKSIVMMMMVFGMALLLLASSSTPATYSHPKGSVRDQYGTQTPHLEATDPEVQRPKRSYPSNHQQLIYYQPYSVWKPPVYQISRPYFIPIFGAPGRVPIYYPPQPLLINPGVPQDNPGIYLPPKMSTPGPTYLPPVEQTTTMQLPNRFDDFEDRPVWDTVEDNRPGVQNAQQSPQRESAGVVPTRRPPRPGASTTTHPPLIHGAPAKSEAALQESRPSGASGNVRRTSTQAPITSNPTNCVWAIISCCSSGTDISYDCFEQRGCVGAFWDRSPCESEFAKAAISSALNYYKSE